MRTKSRIVTGGCALLLFGCGAAVVAEQTEYSVLSGGPRLSTGEPTPAAELAATEDLPTPAHSTNRDDNRWRYRQHEGRWWYLLPSNRWVVWENGRWVNPPVGSIPTDIQNPQYDSAPQYVAPAPSGRVLLPHPQTRYYTDGTYDGPYYYYDEFYRPYGGPRAYPYYPVPRPYPSRAYSYGGYPYGYGGYPYGYGGTRGGVSVRTGGSHSSVRVGIGF